MKFDFDKAYAAFKSQPQVQAWMTMNKADLVAMTYEMILNLVATYALQGDAATAIGTALGLQQQGNAIVGNTADIAQRRYEAGQRLQSLGKLGLQLLLAVLAAGVGL